MTPCTLAFLMLVGGTIALLLLFQPARKLTPAPESVFAGGTN
jgi:hypothetical protein